MSRTLGRPGAIVIATLILAELAFATTTLARRSRTDVELIWLGRDVVPPVHYPTHPDDVYLVRPMPRGLPLAFTGRGEIYVKTDRWVQLGAPPWNDAPSVGAFESLTSGWVFDGSPCGDRPVRRLVTADGGASWVEEESWASCDELRSWFDAHRELFDVALPPHLSCADRPSLCRDGGMWVWRGRGPGLFVTDADRAYVTVSPRGSELAIVGSSDLPDEPWSVHRRRSSGMWELVARVDGPATWYPESRSGLFLLAGDGYYESTDDGRTWHELTLDRLR